MYLILYDNRDRDDVALEFILEAPTINPIREGRCKGS